MMTARNIAVELSGKFSYPLRQGAFCGMKYTVCQTGIGSSVAARKLETYIQVI